MSIVPLLIFALTILTGLFFVSNIVGMGSQEYYYSSDDPFFFYRRCGLLIAGIAGISLYFRKNPFAALKTLGFRTPLHFILIAMLWGIFIGFQSPAQRISGHLEEVLALTILHVIAEEIFFRGFLQSWWGIWLSSLVFALLHIGPDKRFISWPFLAFGASLLLGGLMIYTGNIWASVIAHAVVNFVNLNHIQAKGKLAQRLDTV